MATKIKYLIWGIAMLMHNFYIYTTHLVSFGWDTIELQGFKLYIIVVFYALFALYIIFHSLTLSEESKDIDETD